MNTATPSKPAFSTPALSVAACTKRRHGNRNAGFSLIEMLVAMVILALALGVLYQASAGATRNVRIDERYAYALQIAQSLLDGHRQLQPGGIRDSGVSGDDFFWQISSEPIPANEQFPDLMLHRLQVVVGWEGSSREVRLATIVPEAADFAAAADDASGGRR